MNLPFNWRVTKYDPVLRDIHGTFTGDDWVLFSEVGANFDAGKLTFERYLQIETAYVSAVTSFMAEAGFSKLSVRQLSKRLPAKRSALRGITLDPDAIQNRRLLSGERLQDAIRMALRTILGCKLVHPGRFYVHFGWDYYMYIGSTHPSPLSIKRSSELGLFVEEMVSPYI